MFVDGIFPIGDGLLDVDEERFKRLLVPDDINEIYEVEQTPFARGKFAAVRRAIHKNSGVHFAAKFLKRRRRAQSSDKEIKHEIAVLMLCDGADNIVKLNAVHESRSDTALLLELATGGELQTFLDNEECLNEAQARICMREVLKALQFLHKRSIAHLDLKPQNILLTGERIEDGLKLCDFGISRVVAEGTNVREIVGTPDYVAPEVLQYEPLSLLTDIWSVGVLTYVLLSGFSPFGGETKQETFLNISQCALTFPDKLFGGVSAAAIDFIRRALRIKPNDRMTAAGCLEHIWIKDECSIDRQLLTVDIAQKQANAHDEENDDDDVDDDDDEDDVEVNADNEANGKMSHDGGTADESADDDDDEERNEIFTDDHNGSQQNGTKMDSSDAEHESQPQIATNGKITHNTVSSSSHASRNGINATASKYNSNGTKSHSMNGKAMKNSSSSSSTTTTTTAFVTVPAVRATTIPLQFKLQQQQQSMTTTTTRRHSSADSNKENTFLATKKILPSVMAKKPTAALAATATAATTTTTTTTATILIQPTETSNVIATITLPNGGINGGSNNGCNGASLFPDAPTTPKVIRKTPNTETSPTSVKALVKKFQLEGGSTAIEVHKQQQHHEQQQQTPQTSHSGSNSSSSSKRSPSSSSNGKMSTKSAEKYSTESLNGSGVEQSKKCATANGSGRRASEPFSVVHKELLNSGLPMSPYARHTPNRALCLMYGSGSRYSPTNSTSQHCSKVANTNGSTNNSSCSSTSSSKITTATANGNSNSTSSNGTSTTAAAALLLSNHHHQQQQQQQQLHPHTHQLAHHHHIHHHSGVQHHHLVTKSAAAAANNLSLDQGIIC